MLWWQYQPLLKKILYGGAFISLAAGLTSDNTGIITGVLFFLIFFTFAVLAPNKEIYGTNDKRWIYELTPHFIGRDRKIRLYLSFIGIFLILVAIYFLFQSLIDLNYTLAVVCGIIIIVLFSAWLANNPAYYNNLYITRKLVPLREETTTKEFYEKVKDIQTPFGKALMSFVPNRKEEVAVFRIIDFNWIVFFYCKNEEVRIEALNLDSDNLNLKEANWVILFTQQLANLFSYMENTGHLPDSQDLVKIFKLPYKDEK